jgi:hypothetical protein
MAGRQAGLAGRQAGLAGEDHELGAIAGAAQVYGRRPGLSA